MRYRYGFELEGFWISDGVIKPPPKDYPTDGFPGLIEIRTYGGKSLEDAFSEMFSELYLSCRDYAGLHLIPFHTFSREDKRELRRRNFVKEAVDIQNIYDKPPKYLGNKTIASLQINISNQTREERNYVLNNTVQTESAHYGPLDVARIVKALDKEFKAEILGAKRQLGEYCLKDDRLEYRSLPNTVWPSDPTTWKTLRDRIKKSVEV